MTPEQRIQSGLDQIESEHKVRTLLACESGSRAWGFPSADSDFDVRFIYCHPEDWYLSVFKSRDVIEVPIADDLDISGWDLRKALGLLARSNPPLLEWLTSPILYRTEPRAHAARKDLAKKAFRTDSCSHHYHRMALSSRSILMVGDKVKTKKYFYVLRPLLALRWMQRGLGAPPTEFGVLCEEILAGTEVLAAVKDLIEWKKEGLETATSLPIPSIHVWMESELAHWEGRRFRRAESSLPREELDEAFRALLRLGV
jgi:predicted nucleotidyltransferase